MSKFIFQKWEVPHRKVKIPPIPGGRKLSKKRMRKKRAKYLAKMERCAERIRREINRQVLTGKRQ